MKNIVILSKNASSSIESILKNVEGYSVQVQSNENIKEIKEYETDLVILENTADDNRDLIMINKFNYPVLLVCEKIIEGSTVRSEAYDYLKTPVDEQELLIRVKNLLKVKELKEEIKQVSSTDELTGLHNRSFIHERLEAELSRAKRYGTSLSCILLDIDFFKVVNDIYGYDWGDILLKRLAEIMKKHVRLEDILTRYGDEEYLIVLPNTDEDNAYLFAERLRRDVEAMEFIPDGEEERHPITISGGISSFPFLENVDESANSLIRYAEHALYNAKKRGKNKMIQFSQINIDF